MSRNRAFDWMRGLLSEDFVVHYAGEAYPRFKSALQANWFLE